MTRRRQPSAPHGHAAGFSVLELIIAIAVLSATLIVASEMLLARERQLARAARVANRMGVELAIQQLHRDLRAARAVDAVTTGAWRTDPLVLEHDVGVQVTWRWRGGTLLRERSEGGISLGERRMLDRVAELRWRRSHAAPLLPLVEVEVRYESSSEIIGTGRIGWTPPETAWRRTRVALRGARAQAW